MAVAVPKQQGVGRKARFVPEKWPSYALQVGQQHTTDALKSNTAALHIGTIACNKAAAAVLFSTLKQCHERPDKLQGQFYSEAFLPSFWHEVERPANQNHGVEEKIYECPLSCVAL